MMKRRMMSSILSWIMILDQWERIWKPIVRLYDRQRPPVTLMLEMVMLMLEMVMQ